jgi:hypothetical protein
MSHCSKYFFFSILMILAACSVMFGQKLDNDGLVLIGNVQSVKTIDNDNRRLYEIILRIQFRNESDKTLLMLSPAFMNRKVEFLYQSMGTGTRPPDEKENTVSTFSVQPKILSAIDATDWDWFEWWVQKLDKPDPNQAGVLTLKPGVTLEYSDTINLWQRFRVEGPKDKKVTIWEGFSDSGKVKQGIPLSELPAFTIEYHVAIGHRYKNPEILRDLRARWAAYGRLVIDDDGEFTLKSQRILNSDGR